MGDARAYDERAMRLALAIGWAAKCFIRRRFLIPVLMAWALVARGVRSAAMVGCGVALILTPVALRNMGVGGGLFVTTSQFGPNFYIGNNPPADGTYQPLRGGEVIPPSSGRMPPDSS